MKNYPVKFSVAVATFNHEKYLSRALESIIAQQHDFPFEIVISDGGSSDQTLTIIRSYQEKLPELIRSITSTNPIGFAKNSLRAIRACRGEYIATLDAEDYWTEPTKLTRQIHFLDEHPDFTISSHRFKQRFENTGLLTNDFIPQELFRNSADGAEFGKDIYFKYWLTQKLSVVFRSSALENTPQLDTNHYNLDAQVFWKILSKGKGYLHNFIGGVYSVDKKVAFTKKEEITHSAIQYLLLEELLNDEPDNKHLKDTQDAYRSTLLEAHHQNTKLLDIRQINDSDFTIVSNDNWGREVYKAFGMEEQSPFVGIYIFTDDFINLATNFKHYLKQELTFVPLTGSKYNYAFTGKKGRTYPLALLGKDIELHFIDYTTQDEATEQWQCRVNRINWNNLFFKLDASYEEVDPDKIGHFLNMTIPNATRTCFLSALHRKKFKNLPFENAITWIDYWNSDPEILFTLSLNAFNLIKWLNGEPEIYNEQGVSNAELFRPDSEKTDHYFIRFCRRNIIQLNALLFPEAYTITFDSEACDAVIEYHKAGMEHFFLATPEKLFNRNTEFLDIMVDLSNAESRHIFVLAKGNPQHTLRIDFVARETDPDDHYNHNHENVRLHSDGLEQEIPADFEWMHFDYSQISEQSVEAFFTRVNGFCFYINPGSAASGTLRIIAVFAGSPHEFEKILG